MAYSLTDSLKHERFSVVHVDKESGRLRVKGMADACTDLSCEGAVVVTEDGRTEDVAQVHPGDIITMDQKDGRARQIVVVRRAYEEYSSPEW
jgi:hypothetical protein